MLDKIKQLMEVKKQAERVKRELDQSTIEMSDIEGIKIVIDGSQNFKSLEIDQGRLQDKKQLESDLLRGLNMAIAKSQNLAAQKMKEITGLNIPGM